MENAIRLTEAGLRAGLSYWAIRNAVMRKELRGGQVAAAWWVDSTDLDRFIRDRAAAAVSKQVAA